MKNNKYKKFVVFPFKCFGLSITYNVVKFRSMYYVLKFVLQDNCGLCCLSRVHLKKTKFVYL